MAFQGHGRKHSKAAISWHDMFGNPLLPMHSRWEAPIIGGMYETCVFIEVVGAADWSCSDVPIGMNTEMDSPEVVNP